MFTSLAFISWSLRVMEKQSTFLRKIKVKYLPHSFLNCRAGWLHFNLTLSLIVYLVCCFSTNFHSVLHVSLEATWNSFWKRWRHIEFF
jgi:hypothetical protein